jgi:NitT/TauT family transport system ATP-binding protein
VTTPQTTPKLRLEHVTKQFDIRGTNDRFTAIDDISIDLAEGEFLVLVGPSGCGKSTLLDLLGGLSEPTSGRILLDGREISGPGLDRGIVFQQYALLPWRTARSNIEFGLEAKGLPKKTRRELAEHYLELVGLHGFGDRYPHELSGGMKQRVAIARSLAFDPEVLLMDEPFAALDAQTRESLQDELLRIWRETGKTILFITHGIDEAVYLGQRVAVLTSRPGRIKTIVDIEIDRTVDDVRSGDAFRRHRHDIWSELHSEVERGQAIDAAAVVPTITTEKVKHVQH